MFVIKGLDARCFLGCSVAKMRTRGVGKALSARKKRERQRERKRNREREREREWERDMCPILLGR